MNIHQQMVIFKKNKTMKAYSEAVLLSLKIYENILKFNFLMGRVLDILTVYASFLKRSFIDVKNNEAW